MKVYTVIILTILAPILHAQVFSPMLLVSESPDDPVVVIATDLNNDGYDDVAYSSISDNEISCSMFNPSTGGFNDFILLGTQFPYCISLFAADLNNDGLEDILAVSQTQNKVGWYKNEGSGNFTIQPYLNEDATLAASVTATDVDMDGDIDVVSAQKGDNDILLYLNNGNGNFSEPFVITASAQIPVVVTSADINYDSYPDIISGYGQTDKIVFFLNNGDGTFQSEIVVTDEADFITSIVTADLDNDGSVDIVSTSKNDNKLAWYKNNGGLSFSQQVVISQTITAASGLTVSDFDLDGDIDIAASSPNDDKIYLFRNDSLNFQTSLLSSEVKEPHGITAGDFNNDGLIDIAATDAWESGYTNQIRWFENGKSCLVVHNINKIRNSWKLAIDDFNLDGNPDIFYSGGQYVCYVENQNSGENFGDEQIIFSGGYNIWDLGFMDADSDGFDDLFVADAMGDSFFMMKNIDGTGQFGNPEVIDNQGDGPAGMDFSDIDGDGDYDIILIFVNGNELVEYINDGSGNFSKMVVCDTINSPRSVCFSDYDKDGDDDIFYSDYYRIGYLISDGEGNFSGGGIVADYGTYCDKLVSSDLNNDGFDDIVCNPDYVHWLINNQDGTFSDHEKETWGGSYDVSADDLNNDGVTDIVSAAGLVNRAYYLKNIDLGDDFEINTYAVDPAIRAVETVDINNDGYSDIIIGSWPEENLSWAENFSFRIINQPFDRPVCEGGDTFLSILTAGVIEYQWQRNDGNGWDDIQNNATFEGADNAMLQIHNVTQELFYSEFRCIVTDELGDIHLSDVATLTEVSASVGCVDNQIRQAENTNTYTVSGNEFDPDTIINPCNQNLTLVNDYNNSATLAGEIFQVGNYTIIWMVKDQQGDTVDSCTFNLVVEPFTGVSNRGKDNILIYPNPFDDIIIISFTNGISPEKVDVTDIRGKLILQKEVKAATLKINLSEFEKGVYFIRIKSKNETIVKKVVKM